MDKSIKNIAKKMQKSIESNFDSDALRKNKTQGNNSKYNPTDAIANPVDENAFFQDIIKTYDYLEKIVEMLSQCEQGDKIQLFKALEPFLKSSETSIDFIVSEYIEFVENKATFSNERKNAVFKAINSINTNIGIALDEISSAINSI